MCMSGSSQEQSRMIVAIPFVLSHELLPAISITSSTMMIMSAARRLPTILEKSSTAG